MVALVREVVESTPDEHFDIGLIGTVLERLRPHAGDW